MILRRGGIPRSAQPRQISCAAVCCIRRPFLLISPSRRAIARADSARSKPLTTGTAGDGCSVRYVFAAATVRRLLACVSSLLLGCFQFLHATLHLLNRVAIALLLASRRQGRLGPPVFIGIAAAVKIGLRQGLGIGRLAGRFGIDQDDVHAPFRAWLGKHPETGNAGTSASHEKERRCPVPATGGDLAPARAGRTQGRSPFFHCSSLSVASARLFSPSRLRKRQLTSGASKSMTFNRQTHALTGHQIGRQRRHAQQQGQMVELDRSVRGARSPRFLSCHAVAASAGTSSAPSGAGNRHRRRRSARNRAWRRTIRPISGQTPAFRPSNRRSTAID